LFKEAKLSDMIVRGANELAFVTKASEKSMRLTRNIVLLESKGWLANWILQLGNVGNRLSRLG
jgi:hypothetical protein